MNFKSIDSKSQNNRDSKINNPIEVLRTLSRIESTREEYSIYKYQVEWVYLASALYSVRSNDHDVIYDGA
jgi:hypothetical protein